MVGPDYRATRMISELARHWLHGCDRRRSSWLLYLGGWAGEAPVCAFVTVGGNGCRGSFSNATLLIWGARVSRLTCWRILSRSNIRGGAHKPTVVGAIDRISPFDLAEKEGGAKAQAS